MHEIFLTHSLLSASFLRKINEPFLIENASNFTPENFYGNFNKKIEQNFLVKIAIKNLWCEI